MLATVYSPSPDQVALYREIKSAVEHIENIELAIARLQPSQHNVLLEGNPHLLTLVQP